LKKEFMGSPSSQILRGFISGRCADEAVVFDVKNLESYGAHQDGRQSDCILYEPTSKHIFTMNGKSNAPL